MTKAFEPRLSSRVESLPPYLFAEIERKVAAKRASGVDIISLGIGDPDSPTPAHIVEAMIAGVRDPRSHQYPTNRGTAEFRAAVASYYRDRFGVALDEQTEIVPLLGAKEGIAHICFALLNEADVCLSADPGYPVYTTAAANVSALRSGLSKNSCAMADDARPHDCGGLP